MTGIKWRQGRHSVQHAFRGDGITLCGRLETGYLQVRDELPAWASGCMVCCEAYKKLVDKQADKQQESPSINHQEQPA